MVDFRREVLERSREVPVVVDFWAPWCAPCRTLGPVLDELASSANGRWELVKVNVDEQPDVAGQYRVMSIPAVKMFHRGEPVSGFVGALPAVQVRLWLDEHLPDPRSDDVGGFVRDWVDRGAEAVPALESFVENHPDYALARLRLAEMVAAHDPPKARAHLEQADPTIDLADLVEDGNSLVELGELSDGTGSRSLAHLDNARSALAAHDLDRALSELVESAMIDKDQRDGLARRAAVALFRLLGREHELVRRHEDRLSMAVLS